MPIFRSIANIKEVRHTQKRKTAEQRPVDLPAESFSTSEDQTVSLSKVPSQ